jgi:hypothetical protein
MPSMWTRARHIVRMCARAARSVSAIDVFPGLVTGERWTGGDTGDGNKSVKCPCECRLNDSFSPRFE